MFTAQSLFDLLTVRYDGLIMREKICEAENIRIVIENMDVRGAFVQVNSIRFVFLNSAYPYREQLFTFYHEVYHYFADTLGKDEPDAHAEIHADHFAALMCCPHIDVYEMAQVIKNQYDVSHEIALLRLDYEIKYRRLKYGNEVT